MRQVERIRLAATALSAIDVDCIAGFDEEFDPPGYGVLGDCIDAHGYLNLPDDEVNRRIIVDALDALANDHDERAHYLGASKNERRFAFAASKSLTTAADRVRAIIRR